LLDHVIVLNERHLAIAMDNFVHLFAGIISHAPASDILWSRSGPGRDAMD
jgi:hypothetical protein